MPPLFSSTCTTRWIYLSLLSLLGVFLANAWSEPRIVHGQRCLLVPSQTSSNNNNNNHLPIVLIGGLGQTISSYIPHLTTLAKGRNVLVYECRGQGKIMDTDTAEADYYNNVTIPFQAEQLLQTVHAVLGNNCTCHFVGFSLGARIAMAAACLNDNEDSFIQGLVLTGVATEPSHDARIALYAWKQLLQDDNVQGFCWNALQTTYSSDFLCQNQARLASWIEHMCETNSCRGIKALLQQAYPPQEDPWHVSNMATRLATNKKIKGLIMAGEQDVMAPQTKVEQLAFLLDWSAPTFIEHCGHAVPMEAGRTWRNAVLEFLTKLES